MIIRRHSLFTAIALVSCVAIKVSSTSHTSAQESDEIIPPTFSILYPDIDPERGKQLFIKRDCILCHSVNGVGGKIGQSLDANDNTRSVNLLDFAARMWKGSNAMIKLQESAFDYQIALKGYEIGDIAAFAYDRETQKSLTLTDVPNDIQKKISEISDAIGKGLLDE